MKMYNFRKIEDLQEEIKDEEDLERIELEGYEKEKIERFRRNL